MVTSRTAEDAEVRARRYEHGAGLSLIGRAGLVQLAAYWWAQADPAPIRPGLLAVEIEARRRNGAVRPKGGA